jgi:hypothetical protein
MIDVSVAVTVLFAGWLDRRTEAGPALVRFDRRVACMPFGLVLALVIWAAVGPRSLITALTTGSASAAEVHTVREASVIALGFCIFAAVVVWFRSVASPRLWLRCVVVFMAADLGLVAGTSALIATPSNAVLAGTTPIERYMAAHLAPGGRFDFYDPQGYSSGPTTADTGRPDNNVLARLPSIGGYASIVSQSYNALTLTHTQGELNVPALASDALAQLDLQEILTAPEYFLVPLAASPASLGQVRQAALPRGQDAVLPLGSQANVTDSGYTYYPGPRQTLRAGPVTRWYYGESLAPSVAIVLTTAPISPARIRFGTVAANGQIAWGPDVSVARGAGRAAGAPPARPGVGLAVQVVAGRLPPFQAAITVGGASYELDGSLSSALRPGAWRQQGTVDDYTLLVRKAPPRPIYVEAHGVRTAAPVQVLAQSANAESIRVHARAPGIVVRDVAWDGGWRASISTNGGASESARVDRHGAVQQVKLPAGTDVVTFSYEPRHWAVARALSEGATLLLLVLLLADIVLRRRGRSGRRSRGGGAAVSAEGVGQGE